MQPEARIARDIRKYLDEIGAFCFTVHGSPMMMTGLPDIIACHEGHFIGIEVKQPGQRPSARQEFVHHLIRRAGGVVIVATCPDDVRAHITHV
jgi:Holliday junction resolvase